MLIKSSPLVQKYLQSEQYKQMVDVMKRRERERVMTEIIQQIQAEKEALVAATQRTQSQEPQRSVEEILVENERKIEV